MGLKRAVLLVVVLSLLGNTVSALTMTPLSASISDPQKGREYSFIATLINDDNQDIMVQLMVDPKSFYLADHVTISPQSVSLAPDEKANFNIDFEMPDDISPEKHVLYITPVSTGRKWDSFEVYFEVTGKQFHNLSVTKVDVPDTSKDKTTYISISLLNNGNVIARATPQISILQGDTIIDTVEGESQLMIMPGDTYDVSILYDPSILPEGQYSASVSFLYNDWRNTNSMKDDFKVQKYSDLSSLEGVEKKTITEGESLDVEMSLSYSTDTDYKLDAEVLNTDISISEEGKLSGGLQKQVTFELPTETLSPGNYEVSAEIVYGPNLNQQVRKSFVLVVKSSKSSLLQLILLIAAGALVVGLLIKTFIFTDKDERRKKKLLKKIAVLDKRYATLEKEAKGIISGINGFVSDSNRFLNEKFPGQYEFN